MNNRSLTLDGTVQSLADAITGGDRDSIRYLSIQADPANTAVVYLGSRVGGVDTTLSASNFWQIIPIPVSSIPAAPIIFEFSQNIMSLNDFEVLGTSTEIIHIGWI